MLFNHVSEKIASTEIQKHMGAENVGGLDDLLMGNVAEGSEETSEQIAARIAASQARLAAVRKDEGVASTYDAYLAKVIKSLPMGLLRFAGWLIDREIPSFTILGLISLSNDMAQRVLAENLEVAKDMNPEFLSLIHSPKIRKHVAEWSQAVVMIDRQSMTVKLSSLKKDTAHYSLFAGGLRSVIENYLLADDTEFDPAVLDRLARDMAGWLCVK